MAMVAEQDPRGDHARSWWLQAHQVLMDLKQRGAFVSAKDEGFLAQVKQKLGLS